MGSAAAGLIGLLFVVVTLTSGRDRSQTERGASLYLTPTALHFAVVLSISAVAIMPRLTGQTEAALFGLGALIGLANAIRSTLGIRTPRPDMEAPHWSDFWMYGAIPVTVYLGLSVSCIALWAREPWAAHAMAWMLLTLLLVSIRNAWDLVTWIAPMRSNSSG